MEVLEEIKGVFTTDTITGEVIPIGAGAVLADRIGDRVANALPESVKKPLGKYVDTVSEALVGIGVVGASAAVPKNWKPYVRLAGVAAIGLGVFHGVGHLLGESSPSNPTGNPTGNPISPVVRGYQPHQGKVTEFR